MLMSVPKVSVLLPVYNGSLYLRSAIESIMSQDFRDYELLIVDDGSKDNSRDIVQSYDDTRIKLIVNERNLGLSRTLNRGLAVARGGYVARMDADDICDPQRLSSQLIFMEANPDVAVCGCLMRSFEKPGVVYHFPKTQETHFHLLYGPPVAHPTAMVRSSVLKKYDLSYNPLFSSAQDYDLWSRLADVAKIANLDSVLMSYRSHIGQISNQRRSEQNSFADIVRKRELKKLGIVADDYELANHIKFFRGEFERNRQLLSFSKRWIDALLVANESTERFPSQLFRSYLSRKWLTLCEQSTCLGPGILLDVFAPRSLWNTRCSMCDVFKLFLNSIKNKKR